MYRYESYRNTPKLLISKREIEGKIPFGIDLFISNKADVYESVTDSFINTDAETIVFLHENVILSLNILREASNLKPYDIKYPKECVRLTLADDIEDKDLKSDGFKRHSVTHRHAMAEGARPASRCFICNKSTYQEVYMAYDRIKEFDNDTEMFNRAMKHIGCSIKPIMGLCGLSDRS
jgi:hypothetical protein